MRLAGAAFDPGHFSQDLITAGRLVGDLRGVAFGDDASAGPVTVDLNNTMNHQSFGLGGDEENLSRLDGIIADRSDNYDPYGSIWNDPSPAPQR